MSNSLNKIMPGLKPTLELLRSCPERIAKIYAKRNLQSGRVIENLAHKNSIRIEYVDTSVLDRLCGNISGRAGQITHQGVATILNEADFISLRTLLGAIEASPLPLLLALDQVQDQGNLGAIARAAYALGCAGILLPDHNTASIGPGAMRASAGALALIPVCAVTNLARALDEVEEAGLCICGADHGASNGTNAFNFNWPLPTALVLGNENSGIRPGVAKRCQIMLDIPLARTFDSLNVAQSAAILIALCAARK